MNEIVQFNDQDSIVENSSTDLKIFNSLRRKTAKCFINDSGFNVFTTGKSFSLNYAQRKLTDWLMNYMDAAKKRAFNPALPTRAEQDKGITGMFIPKARQMGVTTWMYKVLCWQVATQGPDNVIFMNLTAKKAKSNISLLLYDLSCLKLNKLIRDYKVNQQTSRIEVYTYVQDRPTTICCVGSYVEEVIGMSAAGLYVTEVGFMPDIDSMFYHMNAMFSTVKQPKILIMEGTYGPYGVYDNLEKKAIKKPEAYHYCFMPWFYKEETFTFAVPPGYVPPDDLLEMQKKYDLTINQICWYDFQRQDVTSERGMREFIETTPTTIEDCRSLMRTAYLFTEDITDPFFANVVKRYPDEIYHTSVLLADFGVYSDGTGLVFMNGNRIVDLIEMPKYKTLEEFVKDFKRYLATRGVRVLHGDATNGPFREPEQYILKEECSGGLKYVPHIWSTRNAEGVNFREEGYNKLWQMIRDGKIVLCDGINPDAVKKLRDNLEHIRQDVGEEVGNGPYKKLHSKHERRPSPNLSDALMMSSFIEKRYFCRPWTPYNNTIFGNNNYSFSDYRLAQGDPRFSPSDSYLRWNSLDYCHNVNMSERNADKMKRAKNGRWALF